MQRTEPRSFLGVRREGGVLGRAFTSGRALALDTDPRIDCLVNGLSFALPLASHVADPVYFFAYTDDGSLSLSCDALESSAVIEVQTGVCPTALSFLAVYEGLAGRGRVIGKAYRSFKALFSDRSSPENASLPGKSADELYFVPSFSLDSDEGLELWNVVVVHSAQLVALLDLADFSLAPAQTVEQSFVTVQSVEQSVVTVQSVEQSVVTVQTVEQSVVTVQSVEQSVVTAQTVEQSVVCAGASEKSASSWPECTTQSVEQSIALGVTPSELPLFDPKHAQQTGKSRKRSSGSTEFLELSEKDNVFFRTTWDELKKRIGWRAEWRRGSTEEVYVVPGGNWRDPLMEGIQYFPHKGLFVAHLHAHPCLYWAWPQLKSRLAAQDWTFSRSQHGYDITYGPAVKARCAAQGVHAFRSRVALTKYIHRFPYLLQSDALLAVSLRNLGWTSTKSHGKELWDHPGYSTENTLLEVREKLWLAPELFLRGVCNSSLVSGMRELSDDQLRASVALSDHENEYTMESETDVEAEEWDEPDEEEEADEEPAEEEEEETEENKRRVAPLMRFIRGYKGGPDELDRKRFGALIGALGWRCELADTLGKGHWWADDYVWVAPWCDVTQPSTAQTGLDFFFDEWDVLRYVRARGHRCTERRPIRLHKDFTSKSKYSRNQRIHELALHTPYFTHNFRALLVASGWELRTFVHPLRQGNSDVWVPYWAKATFHEHLASSLSNNEDYFENECAVLRYLKENGNLPLQQRASKSPQSFSPAPESPKSKLDWLLRHRDSLYRPDTDVWKLLQKGSHGWEHAKAAKGYLEPSVYLAPWARDIFHREGGKTNPKLLVYKRDYFYTPAAVMNYLAKHGNERTDLPPTPDSVETGVRRSRTSSTAAEDKAEKANKASPKRQKTTRVKRECAAVSKRVVTLAVLDEQMRGLAIDLLQKVEDAIDIRECKHLIPAGKRFGLNYFFHSSGSVYSFYQKAKSARFLPGLEEDKDYFVGEEKLVEYVLGQLALLGYVRATNSMDPSVNFRQGDDVSSDYKLKSPLTYKPSPGRTVDSSGTDRYLGCRSASPATAAEVDQAAEAALMTLAVAGPVCRSERKRALSDVTNVAPRQPKRPVEALKKSSSASPETSQESPASAEASAIPSSAAPAALSSASSATLRERIDAATSALLPSAPPMQLVGRNEERQLVRSYIDGAIADGRGAGVYLCGMSGVGKTATAEEVLAGIRETFGTQVVITRACGTGLAGTFSYLAELLQLRDGAAHFNESAAEALCMRQFCPTLAQTNRKNAKDYPVHILFIDEMDKAPKKASKKLFETCAMPNSRLVVIGLANDMNFPLLLGLAGEDVPRVVVFPAINRDQMNDILKSRTCGLFSERAAKVLSMKMKEGDARLLLDLAGKAIALCASKSEFADKLDIVYDEAIVDQSDVLLVCTDAGLGPLLISKQIAEIPHPPRMLLVALVLDRVGKKNVIKLPEMIAAVNTYMDELTWPRFNREDTRIALEVLVNYALVRGGPSRFTKQRDLDEHAFEIVPTIEDLNRTLSMEPKHKAKVQAMLESIRLNAARASSK